MCRSQVSGESFVAICVDFVIVVQEQRDEGCQGAPLNEGLISCHSKSATQVTLRLSDGRWEMISIGVQCCTMAFDVCA